MSYRLPSRSFLDSTDIVWQDPAKRNGSGSVEIYHDHIKQISIGTRLLRKILNLREKHKADGATGDFFYALTELLRAEGVEFHEGDGLSL